eukprot:2994282-Rhodomonas_salina.3
MGARQQRFITGRFEIIKTTKTFCRSTTTPPVMLFKFYRVELGILCPIWSRNHQVTVCHASSQWTVSTGVTLGSCLVTVSDLSIVTETGVPEWKLPTIPRRNSCSIWLSCASMRFHWVYLFCAFDVASACWCGYPGTRGTLGTSDFHRDPAV